MSDLKGIIQKYDSLQAHAKRYQPLWDETAKFVAMQVNKPSTTTHSGYKNQGVDLDFDVDDPTAAISVNQHGDFLAGVIWGTGESAISLKPSRHVLAIAEPTEVAKFYDFATSQVLYHINHALSGFSTALRSYCYDQAGFGTSGISASPNPNYPKLDDHAVLFQAHGVDGMVIAEGKNGLVDTIFIDYWWDAARIVREFCMKADGSLDEEMYNYLPKDIQSGYKRNETSSHHIVWAVMPRDDFEPHLQGKRGTRYKGVWFLYGDNKKQLREESYYQIPIAVARAVKIRGEVYGRAYGTILLSAIRGINYMLGTAYDTMDKMHEPALGTFSSALSGDNVIDASAGSLTVVNPTFTGAESPIFPLYNVGDPSGLIQFAIPFLSEKITSGFKLDTLLDMSDGSARTATESLQRYSIRSKSMSGVLTQQEVELVKVLLPRTISLLEQVGELGIDPELNPELAQRYIKAGRPDLVIPDSVLEVMRAGRPWFEIEINTDLRRMSNSEKLDAFIQAVNIIGAASQIDPSAALAVDAYAALREALLSTGFPEHAILTREQYNAEVKARSEQAAQAQAVEMKNKMSQADRNEAHARLADRKSTGL